MPFEPGTLCRIKAGYDAGRLVRFWFVNSSGNMDCRYEDDGEIVVVAPGNLEPVTPTLPEDQP